MNAKKIITKLEAAITLSGNEHYGRGLKTALSIVKEHSMFLSIKQKGKDLYFCGMIGENETYSDNLKDTWRYNLDKLKSVESVASMLDNECEVVEMFNDLIK